MMPFRHASREASHELRVTDFAHLHNHFWGSYSDSVLSVAEGLDRAAALGQTAMAITDHGELAFVPQFYHACIKRGLNPLLGCECYFVDSARDTIERGDERRNHLILLAKDARGYRNLVSLTSEAWLNNCFRGARGLVDWALLEKYHRGLICLSGCYYGSFPLKTIRESPAAGEQELRRYLDIFGDDFYPEMSRLGFAEQEISNAAIIGLAPRYGLKPVVTNDVHYPYPEDWLAHDIIAKTRFGTVSDFTVATKSIWLKSLAEMRALDFHQDYLHNTGEVAEKCAVRLPASTVSPPLIRGSPSEDLRALKDRCAMAIREKIPAAQRVAWEERFRKEIRLISQARLAGSMLAAAELLSCFRRAKSRVRALEGRGAGSATAYLLGLSDEMPCLSDAPEISAFAHLALSCPNRGSAIKYLIDVLGQEKACRAADMIPISGGDALRYTAEVIGVPREERETGLRDLTPTETVERNLSASRALRALCDAYPEIAGWARRIEGIPRASRPSESTLVLTSGPLPHLLPLKRLGRTTFAQYDAEGARLAGFITLELRDG